LFLINWSDRTTQKNLGGVLLEKKKGINRETKMKLNSLIGKKVRRLRNAMDLSQADFAREADVYQELVSRIESDLGTNIYALKKIADFAKVEVDYFLQTNDDLQEEQKKEYMDWIRDLISDHQFKEAELLLNTPPPNFKEPKDLQFISWNQGIIQSGLYNNQQKANKLFDQAIQETSSTFCTERKTEITISKGVSFLESGDPKQATIQFEKAEKDLRFLKIPYNPQIAVRLAYNRAAAYYDLGEYTKSILECEKAFRINKRHYSAYLAGELHYQLGLSHFSAGNTNLAKYHINGSIFLFQSLKKEKWANHAIQKLAELGLK
jgi:transcriptional regulator with XRE-family HTH domain